MQELKDDLRQLDLEHKAELEAVRRAGRRDLVPYSSALMLYRPPTRS